MSPRSHERQLASRVSRRHGLARLLPALGALLVGSLAGAEPRVPANDAVVLEHLPAATASAQLLPLRARQATHPEDQANALRLAQGYLNIGRANGDPRFASYAEATLAPWLAQRNPAPSVLILAADTLQYLHRFDAALRLLDQALRVQPASGQAWLMEASILQVQGRYAEASQACQHLPRLAGQLIALTCLTSVNSLSGQLSSSYRALRSVFTDDPRLSPGVRVWILDQLAEMAQRSGDDQAGEDDLKRSLRILPQDSYSKAAYADLLLRSHRDAEVRDLLRTDEQQDNLLLRLAIAGTRLGGADGRRWSDSFQARYEAARRDGDYTHLREQARFVLEVRGDAKEAVKLAQRNWALQREPADVRIAYLAARAAGDRAALQTMTAWMQQTHYEDETILPPHLRAMVSR